MQSLLLIAILLGTIIVGTVLYYLCGIFKKLGVTEIEEMNESELVVSDQGLLEENLPEELVSENEAKTVNIFGRVLFLLSGSFIWIFIALTAGQIAYLFRPSDLLAVVFYIFFYFFVLRFPFGVVNKTIKRSYEVEVMPEKLAFAILMIACYVIGINYSDSLPQFFKWHIMLTI